jgi:hypothetical protein
MANLTADKQRYTRGPIRVGKAVAATGTTFFRGSVLAFNATGLLVLAADTAGLRIAGIAKTGSVNAAGLPGASVAGAVYEFEFDHEEWILEVSGTWTGAAVGLDAVMIDDSGSTTAAVAANDIRIGRIMERETIAGAAGQWVRIGVFSTAAF